MFYELKELLIKMGAPETSERGKMSWHYFDKDKKEIEGFATIRFLDDDKSQLVAEQQHLRHNYEDDQGKIHDKYVESFYMYAERIGERYKITKIAFDGEEYQHPQTSIIELGLSLFHSRALDISILMVEQAFNKDDILDRPLYNDSYDFNNKSAPVAEILKKETWGEVIQFRPRATKKPLSLSL